MASIGKERFQSYEPILEFKPNAEAHTGLVGTAKDPRVASCQGMRPQRSFTDVQRDVGRANRHDGAFRILDSMNRLERGPKLRGINLQFGPTPLEAGLGLGHAILNSLDAVPAGKRAPGSHPEALQNGVGIDEDWTLVPRHGSSQLDRGLNPMRREEVRKIVDGQVEERSRPPRRDTAFVNGESDDLHEWL